MSVEDAILQLAKTDVGSVGGDLFEYINFQQRCRIDARIARACSCLTSSGKLFLAGRNPRTTYTSMCIG